MVLLLASSHTSGSDFLKTHSLCNFSLNMCAPVPVLFEVGIFNNNRYVPTPEEVVLREQNRAKKKAQVLINQAKKDCEDIGFTPRTDNFGDCVMRLMD